MTAPTAPATPAPAPRVLVPSVGLTPPRFGLLSAARVVDDVPAHELNGIEYPTVCGAGLTAYPAPCAPVDAGLATEKTANVASGYVAADPLAYYAADDCGPVGREPASAVDNLRTAFLAGEHAAIEYAVDTGAYGNGPSLRDSALPLNGGAALDPADAVAVLEHWIAQTVGTGVIHAPRYFAGRVDNGDRKPQGQRSQTLMGNTWAWGSGYTGAAPLAAGDTPADGVWLYATAPVTVRRGPLVEPVDWTSGGFDQTNNGGLLLVERLAVVDWPCRAAAVATTAPRIDVGGEA